MSHRAAVIGDVILGRPFEKDAPLKGIEIGCLAGEFDREILGIFPHLKMTAIDPNPQYLQIYQNVKEYMDRLRIIESTSDNAIKFLQREYHFVFIDGDHSYEQTRRDILNYWQVILKGGILAGHNYDVPENPRSAHPGVAQAVIEIFGDRFKAGQDATWWIYV